MSYGPIDKVSQFVADNLTKKMYTSNRHYWNERGDFLFGNLHDDVVALIRRAHEHPELVTAPNIAMPKPENLIGSCDGCKHDLPDGSEWCNQCCRCPSLGDFFESPASA